MSAGAWRGPGVCSVPKTPLRVPALFMALLCCVGCFGGDHEALISKRCSVKIALCPRAWLSLESVLVREAGKRRNAEIPAGSPRPDCAGLSSRGGSGAARGQLGSGLGSLLALLPQQSHGAAGLGEHLLPLQTHPPGCSHLGRGWSLGTSIKSLLSACSCSPGSSRFLQAGAFLLWVFVAFLVALMGWRGIQGG